MATWNGNNVTVSSPHVARTRIETQLAGQNVGGNFSTINWQIYCDFFGCDAQLDGGFAEWSGGVVYNNGGRVYNYAGNFSNHTVTMATGSFNVGADANGNSSYGMDGHVSIFSSGVSTASGSEGLPRMALAPNFVGLTVDTIKPSSARLGAEIGGYGHGTSAAFNMYYRLQGSSTWLSLGVQGDVGGFNYWTATGLIPGKVYEYTCNVWNNNSGEGGSDGANSGTQTFKTTPVSGMMAIIRGII